MPGRPDDVVMLDFCFRKTGKTKPLLLAVLLWAAVTPYAFSAASLQEQAAAQKQVQAALRGLAAPVPASRLAALQALAALGPEAAPAVPSIIDIMTPLRAGFSGTAGSPSPAIIDACLKAIRNIGAPAQPAAPYLVAMLDDPNQLLRRQSVLEALEATGLDNSATATIMKVVGEEGKFTSTRLAAIRLLGKIDPPATDALDLLKEICADQTDSAARSAASQAISSISARSKTQTDEDARKARQNTDSDASALRAQLGADKSKKDKLAALSKIAEIGAGATSLVPLLLQLLKSPDKELVAATADALSAVGEPARSAAPALLQRLSGEKSDSEAQRLAEAIAAVDPSGQTVMPLIKPMLDDPFRAPAAIRLLDQLGTDQAIELAAQTRKRWCIK